MTSLNKGRWPLARLALLCASILALPAHCLAQPEAEAMAATADGVLESVIVTAKANETIGTALSASAGTFGGVELSQRPILRPGELLEATPGMMVTAHTSGGKANQYYLRGFNLDHGTDFATSVDGAPVNLGSHAHGQGYMDLNWLIPELVAGVAYRKGPYYADAGDFSAAGNAAISYLSVLPDTLVQLEGGTDNYQRGLLAGSAILAGGQVLYAAEYIHYDGPFRVPGDFQRPNGVLKYTLGDANRGGGLTFQAYEARWVASDQIPDRAIPALPGGRYGSIDPTSTGRTNRYSLVGEWHWGDANLTHQIEVYAVRYGLNLYSDFSYFIDQVHGDQFRQYDNRSVLGAVEKTTISGDYLGLKTNDAFGVQSRNDFINIELDHTKARRPLQIFRTDQVTINSLAAWWSNAISWTPALSTQFGLRLEGYRFHLRSSTPANGGDLSVARPAPKLGVTFAPRADLRLYAQAGVSYRSNDARGIFDTAPSYPGGPTPSQHAKPLVRSEGAEIGASFRGLPGLTSTVAAWYLRSNSELFFAGDTGANTDSDRAGERYGIELNNIYRPTSWLTVDADVALSQAFFTKRDPAVGNQIPEAIKNSVSAAAIIHDLAGIPGVTGSLRLRYFAPRNLVEDGTERSKSSTIVNARLSYDLSSRAAIGLEALNLFNVKYNDAEYFAASRLKGEPANPGSDDGSYLGHVIHAGEPLEARLSITLKL